MKNEILGAVLISSVVGLGITGCSSSDKTTQQVTPETETPVEVSKVSIRLLDTGGNPLANVPVTFDDNDTGLLAKFAGRSVSNLASKGLANKTTTAKSDSLGFVVVELKKGTTTGNLSLSVNDEGYFPVTEIFQIGGEATIETFKLTPKPADGETVGVEAVNEDGEKEEVISIVAAQEFETDQAVTVKNSDGTEVPIQASITKIETSTTGTNAKDVVAEVVIPNTVSPKTADGEAATGDLKISAAVYQNSSETSVDAFPGGLVLGGNLTNDAQAPEAPPTDESDTTDTTGFVTAGFVALDVTDEAGKDITNFEGDTGVDLDGDGQNESGLLVTTLVPKATTNPATGTPVKLGDIIPVWSYNDESAQWTFDGNAKIFESADNENWNAHFAAKHLSYWNLDFRVSYCSSRATGETALIEFKTAPNGPRDERMLIVSTFRDGLGYYATRTVNMDGYVRGYLPRERLKLRVLDVNTFQEVNIQSINGSPYNSETGFNFCDRRSLGNDVVLEQPVQPLVDLNVRVETSCSDSTLDAQRPPEPIPSTNVLIFNGDNTNLLSQTLTNASGEVTLTGLAQGTPYNLYVENRLAPIDAPFADSYQERAISSVAAASNPEVFDFEQECTVTTTTGSDGGS